MIFFTGCRELYSVMCWLLCGYLRFGHLWPPQWQHHDQEVWTHVPYWLWKDPGQCPNAWEHQEVNRWMYTLYVGNNLSTSDIVHVHIRCDPSDHLGLDSKINVLSQFLCTAFVQGSSTFCVDKGHGVCDQWRGPAYHQLSEIHRSVLCSVQWAQETLILATQSPISSEFCVRHRQLHFSVDSTSYIITSSFLHFLLWTLQTAHG